MADAAYAEDLEAPEGAEEHAAEQKGQPDLEKLLANVSAQNIADQLDDATLGKIGAKVCEEFKIDEESRKEQGWDVRCQAAMKLALQTREAKNTPWPNASNVKFPLITTAAIQFNARAYPAVVDGSNIVKGKVQGKPSEEKQARADRIGAHMSYQLLVEMEEWEEDTDRLLILLPILGSAFRKVWFDPVLGRNRSCVVTPDKFVVNYWTQDLEVCPRATHVLEFYPHEIAQKMRSGLWLDIELGPKQGAANDDEAPHTFLEQHRLLDLDDDDYPEPYIVTVHQESQRVVRIVARYDADGVKAGPDGRIIQIDPVRVFTKYGFIPAPDGSFYDVGFGTLLDHISETINTTINQLMDAGRLANMQGGFIGEGVSLKSGKIRLEPGEWRKASALGGPLRDQIVPLPVKEPSAVLFNLLGMLIESAKDVTATQDILTGDTVQSNQPVGTTLAMIEQGLKTFTAIVKRIHRALKRELATLYRLNSQYLEDQAYFTFQDIEGVVARQDYAEGDCDVVPVSDPTMATDMQRMGRAQYLGQFLGKGLNDMAIVQRMLEAAGIQDIKDLMPQGPPPIPPEIQAKMKELEQKDQELARKEGELQLKAAEAEGKLRLAAAEAEARIGVDEATAQKTMAEAILLLPNFQLQVAQAIDQRISEAQSRAMEAAQPQAETQDEPAAPPPGPTDLPGADQPPAVSALAPVLQGPAEGAGGPMDGGPGDDPPAADQGPPDGGAGGPQLV